MASVWKWVEPWEFSWVFLATFVFACVLYVRGCRRLHVSAGRQLAFWIGMAIIYVSLQTYLDYFAEHEFFMHRTQQLLLHHLAPLLICATYPMSVLRAGLPLSWRSALVRPLQRSQPWRVISGVLFNPAVATVLFVLFVLIWLWPPLQTLAMLDWRIYRFMNWTMLISGFVYWSLVLDHRPHPPARMITFSRTDLYPIFELCGRAFTFNVLTGQMIGGLITWVPAAFIESIGALLALRVWLRLSRAGRLPKRAQRSIPASTPTLPVAQH